MLNANETDAIAGLLAGDSTVIRNLYKTLFPKVAHYITGNSGSLVDAQDIFQEALMITYEKLKGGTLELRASLPTYIYAVAVNLWRNQLRKNKRFLDAPKEINKISESHTDDILELIYNYEREHLVQRYFVKLEKTCQQLLQLFFKKKSMREISEKLNFTIGYTRKKKFDCKKKLIEMIEADAIFEELKNPMHSKKGDGTD